MSTSKYVDSHTVLNLSSGLSEGQKSLATPEGSPVPSSISSMQIPVICKQEVQTYCATPTVSSEAIIHRSSSLSEHQIITHTTGINSTETVTPTNIALPSLTASTTGIDFVTHRLSLTSSSIGHGMDPNSLTSAQVDSTALGTRTTENVIADLRRPLGRLHHQHRTTQGSPSSDLQGAVQSQVAPPLDSGYGKVNLGPAKVNEDSEDDTDDHDEGENDDDEDEVRQSTRTKKVSERKRRMNAVADQYILTLAQKANHEDNGVKPEDEAHQSARWLVNQSENREIISSPREYQTELFERAKEKNIIAVLDTGVSQAKD